MLCPAGLQALHIRVDLTPAPTTVPCPQVTHELRVQVKISADARVMTKASVGRKELMHTEWNVQVFDDNRPEGFQALESLFTLSVYRGNDDHDALLRNSQRLFDSLRDFQNDGSQLVMRLPNLTACVSSEEAPEGTLPQSERLVRGIPVITVGGDMSFVNHVFGVGGVRDPVSMCAFCICRPDDRWH